MDGRQAEGSAQGRGQPLEVGVAVAVEEADNFAAGEADVQLPRGVGPVEDGPVVDVDGSPALYELPEFKGRVGCGETAWVRDGKIVATSGRRLNVECFEPNTLALLSMP